MRLLLTLLLVSLLSACGGGGGGSGTPNQNANVSGTWNIGLPSNGSTATLSSCIGTMGGADGQSYDDLQGSTTCTPVPITVTQSGATFSFSYSYSCSNGQTILVDGIGDVSGNTFEGQYVSEVTAGSPLGALQGSVFQGNISGNTLNIAETEIHDLDSNLNSVGSCLWTPALRYVGTRS